MSFDLNLDNYKKNELEEIFELPLNYNEELIILNEKKMTQNILNDNSVDNSKKKKNS